MIDAVKTYLDESEFTYQYHEELSCFDLGLNVENGVVHVRLMAREEEAYFIAYVLWEGKLPVRSLPVVLPILNEINDNTKFTTISVDPKTGELACHCGLNTDDSGLSPRQVAVTMQVAVKTLDDNIERIMRAAWSAPANIDGKYN